MKRILGLLLCCFCLFIAACEQEPPPPTALQQYDTKCRAQKFYYFMSDASQAQFCGCMVDDFKTRVTEPVFEQVYNARHQNPREAEVMIKFTMNRCIKPVFTEFLAKMCTEDPASPVKRMKLEPAQQGQVCNCASDKVSADYERFFAKLEDVKDMTTVMKSDEFKKLYASSLISCAVGVKLITPQ